MLLLINEWKIVSFLNSTNSNYTFGIISSPLLVAFSYWLEASSLWQCDMLIDLTAIDLLAIITESVADLGKTVADTVYKLYNTARFLLIYNLLSLTYNFRVQLLVKLVSSNFYQTIAFTFKSARWLEREIWDLFGLIAARNRDLRRIITDYGFEGHPMRKDFPLIGFFELFYNEAFKRIMYYPVEVAQEFRLFRFKL